jgi:hypothetical protein
VWALAGKLRPAGQYMKLWNVLLARAWRAFEQDEFYTYVTEDLSKGMMWTDFI